MKRKRVKPNYIDVRISQLKEDMSKANQPHDQLWYNRLIQELSWAKSMTGNEQVMKNCYMESDYLKDIFVDPSQAQA